MEPTNDASQRDEVRRDQQAEDDSLDDYKVAGLESKHPSLIMFLYSSPIIGCLLMCAVPFIAIALAGTRRPTALIVGLVVLYLLLLGSIVAPFLVYRRRQRQP